jgi:hypothetical protein
LKFNPATSPVMADPEVAKMFKKHPMQGTALKQWGVATGFFASSAD